jgi:spoIIIJ-associated protein
MIKVYKYEGKDEEECLTNCIEELDVYACDLFVQNHEEEDKFWIEVIKKEDIKAFIKEYLTTTVKMMNLDINLEIREDENIFNVTMVSNNNPILIGKEGKNLNSIQFILRQTLKNMTGLDIKVNLDASNYRAKKVRNFEYQIKNIVREVQKTKTDTKLDPMNSYQRRIVHALLSDFSNVTTESVGEEPNRCVVIKYIGD